VLTPPNCSTARALCFCGRALLTQCPALLPAPQIVPIVDPSNVFPILACQDRSIRVLSNGQIMLQVCMAYALVLFNLLLDTDNRKSI